MNNYTMQHTVMFIFVDVIICQALGSSFDNGVDLQVGHGGWCVSGDWRGNGHCEVCLGW